MASPNVLSKFCSSINVQRTTLQHDLIAVLYYSTLKEIEIPPNWFPKRYYKRNLKSKPNFFFGIRIDDSSILQQITEIQQQIQRQFESRQSNMHKNNNLPISMPFISPKKMHLTLFVMTIESKDALEYLLNLFETRLGTFLKEQNLDRTFGDANELQLHLKGLNSFSEQVVYVEMIKDENISKLFHFTLTLTNWLRNEMQQFQLDQLPQNTVEFEKSDVGNRLKHNFHFHIDNKQFTPHVTIFKSRSSKTKLSKQNWEEFSDTSFGKQLVKEIELLEMQRMDEDGYYRRHASINISTMQTKQIEKKL